MLQRMQLIESIVSLTGHQCTCISAFPSVRFRYLSQRAVDGGTSFTRYRGDMATVQEGRIVEVQSIGSFPQLKSANLFEARETDNVYPKGAAGQ